MHKPSLSPEVPPMQVENGHPLNNSELNPRDYYKEVLASLGEGAVRSEIIPDVAYGPGFQIERARQTEPLPVAEVLATTEDRVNHLFEGLVSGATHMLSSEEQPTDKTVLATPAIANVRKADYEKAVEAGDVQKAPEDFMHGAFMAPNEAEEAGFSSHFADEKLKAWKSGLKEYVEQHPTGYELLPREITAHLENITEAFELEVFGKTCPLFNFSSRKLTDKKLAEICNGLRSVAQRTGGSVLDKLDILAIIPAHDEELSERNKAYWWSFSKAGSTGGEVITAEDSTHASLVINGRQLEEGQGSETNPSVGAGRQDGLELTIVHELGHVNAVGHNLFKGSMRENVGHFGKKVGWIPRADNLGEKEMHIYEGKHEPVSHYAGVNAHEDEAETTTALHVGDDTAKKVSDDRIAAIQETWAATHSGIQGPAYVRCRELDLKAIHEQGSKVGLDDYLTEVKLPTYYMLKQR